MVDYLPLGASGLRVPRLWLGAMMFGDQTGEAEAREIVAATRDAGLNAIDVADMYAGGESERMVGRLIAADRERWIVASKVANPMGTEPNDRGLSRRWLLAEVDNSLRRLGTDWIDLWYMHRDDEVTPIEETVSTVGRLIELGKIRYWGLSNFRAWRIARVVETARRMGVPPPIACQPPYSAVTRLIETELLPCCAHYGVGVVAYSPLARGVLSGKYVPGAEAQAGTRAGRGDRRILQTEFRPESLEVAQRIKAHALSRGLSPTQFAIAWALNNQLVNGVIGGPRTLEQWRDYIAALEVRLTAEDEAFVDAQVPPGYASTYGYNDPAYPITGRVAR
ncbi:aldo/keto reductase [uncultured Azohydromonas sp.]|jgi:Predicted oxidoreductases (related to aryl-alcohol dehydrogenases)|uniref:aldo/keto reductase n=1 Tax=uncultured Azohydromonas sp. TaxID=487342 RepID=UPI0026201C94|nr:aldo/keto reductase [uncultured Azohydromonas sp.]